MKGLKTEPVVGQESQQGTKNWDYGETWGAARGPGSKRNPSVTVINSVRLSSSRVRPTDRVIPIFV